MRLLQIKNKKRLFRFLAAVVIAPEFVYNSGYPQNCSNSNASWFGTVKDACAIPNERPTAVGFTAPAIGTSYTDPNFGNTVRTLARPRNVHLYASLGAFNSDGAMVPARIVTGMGSSAP